MRSYVIVRVPVILDKDATPMRRTEIGHKLDVVGEVDTAAEASKAVAIASFGDTRHHFYALEVCFKGEPDRKSAIAVSAQPSRGTKLKLAVNNRRENKA